MRIVFHGTNAQEFMGGGFTSRLAARHEIQALAQPLAGAEEEAAYRSAEVVIAARLGAEGPAPESARLFHVPGAGTDAVDRARLPQGCVLCNCFGHEGAIAEYVMAALLLRHVPLPIADRDLREGRWTYWAGAKGSFRSELGDRTMGLLGYGHIGKALAARAKAFGMRVVVCNRSPVPPSQLVDRAFTLDRLSQFIAAADDIVVSLPLTPETTGIVGPAALGAMRRHAMIVNVGRGPVIEERALFDALAARRIAGAILDTWYVYPSAAEPNPHPSRLPFHTLDNCVLTPHMSGWTSGTIRRRQEAMAENVNRLARGAPLLNVVA
jgi:phosphoglycerate dehydrogenase-like enzyme